MFVSLMIRFYKLSLSLDKLILTLFKIQVSPLGRVFSNVDSDHVLSVYSLSSIQEYKVFFIYYGVKVIATFSIFRIQIMTCRLNYNTLL